MFGSSGGFGSSGFGLNQNKQASTFGSSTGTQGFGSTGNAFSASTGLGTTGFGQQSSNRFPSGSSTTGGLFGSSTTSAPATAGFFNTASTGGAFGSSNTSTTPMTTGFGMQSSGFGSQSTGFGSSIKKTGTSHTPFEPKVDRLPETGVVEKIQCITAMDAYQQWSQEELRAQDYEAGNKFGSGTMGFGTSALSQNNAFGANKLGTSTNSGSLFSSSTNAFGLGNSTTTTGFGAKPATTGAFGSTQSTGFGSLQSGGMFGSNSASTNAFGTAQTGSTFGSASTPFGSQTQPATNSFMSNSSQSGFGGFGQQSSGFGTSLSTTSQPATTGFGSSFGQSNTTSSLGSASKPATSGFSFSNTSNTSNSANTSIFGNSSNTSNSLSKPGGFGSGFGTSNTGSTSLFGTNNTTTGQTGGLFGNKQPSTTGTSLFSQQPSSLGFGTNTQQTGSSLFGNTGVNNSSSTGLFSSNNSTTLGNTSTGGSLFGNTTTTGASMLGSFGNQNNNLSQNQNTLGFNLANNNAQQQGSTLGGGLFGNSLANSGVSQNSTSIGSGLFGNSQPNLTTQNNSNNNPLYASATQNPFGNNPLFNSLSSISSNVSASNNLKATPVKKSESEKHNHQTKKLPLTSVVLGTPKSISSINRQQTKSSSSNMGLVPTTPRRSRLSMAATPINASDKAKTPVASSSIGMFSESGFLAPDSTIRNSVTRLTPKQKVEFPPYRASGYESKQSLLNSNESKADSVPNGNIFATPEKFVTPNSEPRNKDPEFISSANKKSITPTKPLKLETDFYLDDQNIEALYSFGDYWTSPTIEELRKLSPLKLKSVNEFMCGRYGYGQIRFDEPVDLTSVGAMASIPGQIILFANKVCTVYPDENTKPPRGSGLNVPAIISLENCWPVDKSTLEPIKSMTDTRVRNHIRRLKRIPDTQFLDFVNGKWIFKVEHFSKYGLYDEDEDDFDDDDDGGDHGLHNGIKKFKNEENNNQNEPSGFRQAVVAKDITSISNGGSKSDVNFEKPNHFGENINPFHINQVENFKSVDVMSKSSEYSKDVRDSDFKTSYQYVSNDAEPKASSLFRPSEKHNQGSLLSSLNNNAIDSPKVYNTQKSGEFGKSSFYFKNYKNLRKLNERAILGQKRKPPTHFNTFNVSREDSFKSSSPKPENSLKNNPPSAVKGRNASRFRSSKLSVKFAIDSKNVQRISETKIRIKVPKPTDVIYNCLDEFFMGKNIPNSSYSSLSSHKTLISDNPKDFGVDAGLVLGNSFRVGFGPGGSFVYSNFRNKGSLVTIRRIPIFSDCPRYLSNGELDSDIPTDNLVSYQNTLQLNKATIESLIPFTKILHTTTDLESFSANRVLNKRCPKSVALSSSPEIAQTKIFSQIFDSISSKLSSQFPKNLPDHYEKGLWTLCSSLFDHLPINHPNSQISDSVHDLSKIDIIESKKRLTEWIQSFVKKNVISDLNSLYDGDADDLNSVHARNLSARSIFYFLSGNQIDKACLAASSARDYHLATILSQIGSGGINGGGSDGQLQELIKSQLVIWNKINCNSTDKLQLSAEYRRLYELISGDVKLSCNSECSDGTTCRKLDWLRSLGMVMWYGSNVDDSILSLVKKYKILVEEKKAPHPLPMWFCDMNKNLCDFSPKSELLTLNSRLIDYEIYDASFQLLMLFCGHDNSLERLLNPSGYSFNMDMRLPYMFGWILNQIYGFKFKKQQLTFDYLVSMMSFQLEYIGLWHYSVFVLLQISDQEMRDNLVFETISRSLTVRNEELILGDEVIFKLENSTIKSDLTFSLFSKYSCWGLNNDETFIIEKCGVPPQWIAKARAASIRGSNYKFDGTNRRNRVLRLLDEFRWIVTSGDLNYAYNFLVTFMAPDCILSSNLNLLSNLLYVTDPNSSFLTKNDQRYITSRVSQVSWDKEGYTYSTYISIINSLPELLSKTTLCQDIFDQDTSRPDGVSFEENQTQSLGEVRPLSGLSKFYSDSSKLLANLYTMPSESKGMSHHGYFNNQREDLTSTLSISTNKANGTGEQTKMAFFMLKRKHTYQGEILSEEDVRKLRLKWKIAFNHISSVISGINIQLMTYKPPSSGESSDREGFNFVVPNKSLQITPTQRLNIVQTIATDL
ncbi:Nucleoporin [Smittium mucronatum]|uniref:Nucleoporin n=1 Tax=Smittium mucronatum TaxID=133383 RepID=A0A1R0H980_9FUNG|nr:Nucleoporin [Smittium mucronatum]